MATQSDKQRDATTAPSVSMLARGTGGTSPPERKSKTLATMKQQRVEDSNPADRAKFRGLGPSRSSPCDCLAPVGRPRPLTAIQRGAKPCRKAEMAWSADA